jgi:hypothetical protein
MIVGTQAFQPVRPVELHSAENGEAGMFRSPGQQRVSNPLGAQATDLSSNDDSLVTRSRFRLTFPPRNAAK